MNIAIIQFPGSNCERETMLAVRRAGMNPIEFLWNEDAATLDSMDGFIIVGGFSYEDRSRAGVIAAHAPVMQVLKIQSDKGKPILGICNGAQILIESGLVPGLENNKLAMALTENKRIKDGKIIGTGYYNTWTYVKLSPQFQRNAFTKHLSAKSILHIPLAHAEGRFVISPALLIEIKQQGLNIFEYCDKDGNTIDEFPINPNGSIENIAAVANKTGNVLAIMPHPERSINGDDLFRSMRDYIQENNFYTPNYLSYYPRKSPMKPYVPQHKTFLVELIITDNAAVTVENALQQLNIPVTVKRYVHWEIDCDADDALQQIINSGYVFNTRKEKLIENIPENSSQNHSFLIQQREDLIGKKLHQHLQIHGKVPGLNAIAHSIVWHFFSETDNMTDLKDQILTTNLLYNPYAYDCFDFRNSVLR